MRKAGEVEVDPLPLSAGQLRALALAAGRELSWGQLRVRRETRKWERLAERIPDQPIRDDALKALRTKRGNVVGAALFSTLASARNPALVRMLVSFQIIFDFLDNLSERHRDEANGVQLHLALVDALDARRSPADYYLHHPWRDDAGYLQQLVEYCRNASQELPSYSRIRHLVVSEIARGRRVLPMNHLPTDRLDRALQEWADEAFPNGSDLTWYELGAAASSTLHVFAVLALAAEPYVQERDIAATYATYWPQMSCVGTMLDSFVDQVEDAKRGEHLYVGHYPGSDRAAARLTELIAQTAREVVGLPNGPRHAVLMGCMIAFYLSKDSARAPALRSHTKELIDAGGSLTQTLTPILRLWRAAYSQSSA